jgi:hypothetical protein
MAQDVRSSELLAALECPDCHAELRPRPGKRVAAASFEDCLRRCVTCGIGFSNARTAPVRIVAAPEKAVPPDVRDGLLTTLGLAVNKTNAKNKRAKFGFITSEDALTWTAFRRLQLRECLRATLHSAGIIQSSRGDEPALLLWGAPVPDDDARAVALSMKLEDVSIVITEDSRRRTEPDVVLDFGAEGIVLVEVKHRSGNHVSARGHWDRYLNAACFNDLRRAEQCGLYELVRNWRFAHDIAADRPFALVNLGPERLFRSPALDAFGQSLAAAGRGRFVKLAWNRLVSAPCVRNDEMLCRFLEERGVLASSRRTE